MNAHPNARSALDISALLEEGGWTTYQKFLAALTAIAVTFDGMDLQILGFSIPSIMREWHLSRGAFAPALALGLVGMALGSVVAGWWGDHFGRRTALLGSVLLIAGATFATAFSRNITELAILRFLTGMGAGGVLPIATALTAEFAPMRRRGVAVLLTIVCVPVGGMFGGLAAARILPAFGWRAFYLFGGVAPAAVALLLFLFLPESPCFLARHSKRWDELIALLRRMGRYASEGSQFVDPTEQAREARGAFTALFGPLFLRDTLGLWLAFFFGLSGVYLMYGWLPAMLSARGLDVAIASNALASWNLGGVFGVVLCVILINAVGSRLPLVGGSLAAVAVAAGLYFIPISPNGGHTLLIAVLGLHGLFVNAVQTSMFAVAAHVYPTKVRATGIAAANAVGRPGGLVSSITGAAIIQAGPAAFLGFLAVGWIIVAIGLAVVHNHIGCTQRSAIRTKIPI